MSLEYISISWYHKPNLAASFITIVTGHHVGELLEYQETGITDVDKPEFTISYDWQRFDKNYNYLDKRWFLCYFATRKKDIYILAKNSYR